LDTVHRDFQTCTHPENLLVKELHTVGTNTFMQKVILLGASNIGHCADSLRREGIEVLDLSSPGWLASPENIALLLGNLKKFHAAWRTHSSWICMVTSHTDSSNSMAITLLVI
jgi:hypothetical protein